MRATRVLAEVFALALFASPVIAADADVRAWRAADEKEIVDEFSQLLSLPNVATNIPDIERNATFIVQALQRRGFKTQMLSAGPGTPPTVFGELSTPGAARLRPAESGRKHRLLRREAG